MAPPDPSSRFERRGGLEVLTFPIFDGCPLDAVVTTRAGGVSTGPYWSLNLGLHVGDAAASVVENRRRAAAAVGLSLDELVFCNQSHGRVAVEVTREDAGRGARSPAGAIDGVDALLTRDRGIGLVVMVADCVPVVLFDPATATVACVHAGWRGTVARVAAAAVEAMAAGGTEPADVLAAVGPAVPAARYQVGADVAEAVAAGFGADLDEVLEADGAGRWRFDLWAANRRVLQDAGLDAANVAVVAHPTSGDGPFFSDRAARPCGRFAAIARLR